MPIDPRIDDYAPDDDVSPWVCDECGAAFSVASASSADVGGGIVAGVKCPVCGAFVPDDEYADGYDDDE